MGSVAILSHLHPAGIVEVHEHKFCPHLFRVSLNFHLPRPTVHLSLFTPVDHDDR